MSIYVSHVSLPLFVASLRSCGCSLVFLSLRCTSHHSCCCSRLCLRHGLESRLRQTSDCITSSSVPFTCHRLFIIIIKKKKTVQVNLQLKIFKTVFTCSSPNLRNCKLDLTFAACLQRDSKSLNYSLLLSYARFSVRLVISLLFLLTQLYVLTASSDVSQLVRQKSFPLDFYPSVSSSLLCYQSSPVPS